MEAKTLIIMRKRLLRIAAFFIAAVMMCSSVPTYAAENGLKTKTIDQKSSKNDKDYKIKKGHYSKVLVRNYKDVFWYNIVMGPGVIIDEMTIVDYVPDSRAEAVIELRGATIKKLNIFSDLMVHWGENGHIGTVNVIGNVNECSIIANTDKINVYGNSNVEFSGFDWTRHTLKELNIYGENCSFSMGHTCTVNTVNYDYKAFKDRITYGDGTYINKLNYTGIGDKAKKAVSKKEAKERINEGIGILVLDKSYTYIPNIRLKNGSRSIPYLEDATLTTITQILDLYNIYYGDQLSGISIGIKIRKDKGSDYSINGVHIGATTKQLKKAFGKWDESYKTYYDIKVYNYGSYKLLAFIEDGKIVEMQVSKSFEEMTKKERKAAKKAWEKEQKNQGRVSKEEDEEGGYSKDERKIELSDGNPVGEEIAIDYSFTNELISDEEPAVSSFVAQKLDNDYTRFTLKCTVPEKMNYSVFNPPEGSVMMLLGRTEDKGETNVVFDIKNSDLTSVNSITVNFYSDNGSFWINFITSQLITQE